MTEPAATSVSIAPLGQVLIDGLPVTALERLAEKTVSWVAANAEAALLHPLDAPGAG